MIENRRAVTDAHVPILMLQPTGDFAKVARTLARVLVRREWLRLSEISAIAIAPASADDPPVVTR